MPAKCKSVFFLLLLCISLCVIFLSGCVFFRNPTDAERYAAWSKKHGDEILAYQNFLDKNAVGDIVPLSQLLKSARNWKKCHAEAFTIPPKEL